MNAYLINAYLISTRRMPQPIAVEQERRYMIGPRIIYRIMELVDKILDSPSAGRLLHAYKQQFVASTGQADLAGHTVEHGK